MTWASRTQIRHCTALQQATACLGEHAPQFVGEQAFRAQLGSLVKAVAEHLKQLQTRNSARLDTRCKAVREALHANATALVKPLLAKSTDEKGGCVVRMGMGRHRRPSVRFDDHDLTLSPIHDPPQNSARGRGGFRHGGAGGLRRGRASAGPHGRVQGARPVR